MTYNILAIIIFILAVCLVVSVKYRSSFTALKFKGKAFYRKSKAIYCKVLYVSLSRNGNAYIVFCTEDGGPETKILAKKSNNKITDKIWLIESEISEGKLYSLMPATVPTNMPIRFFEKDSDKEITISECEKLSKILKIIYIGLFIALVVSFLSIGVMPLLSIVLDVMAIIISLQNVPFKNWTRNEGCGIIRENKDETLNSKDCANNLFPLGYDEWTDTEKVLFDIEARVGAKSMLGDEFSHLDETEDPKKKENWVESDEITIDDFSKDTPQPSNGSVVPRACCNCGCIVDNDDSYCPHCGEKLDEPHAISGRVPMITSQKTMQNDTVKTTDNTISIVDTHIDQTSQISKQEAYKKKNRRHRSRKGNANGSNSELSSVLAAAAEESLL